MNIRYMASDRNLVNTALYFLLLNQLSAARVLLQYFVNRLLWYKRKLLEMGCIESKLLRKKKDDFVDVEQGNVEQIPELGEKQKDILLESWVNLKSDITKVGVVTFMK